MGLKGLLNSYFGKSSTKKIGHFEYLFIALILTVLIKPFFKGFIGIQILTNILFTIIYLAAIFTVIQSHQILRFSLWIVVPTIVLTWWQFFYPNYILFISSNIFSLVFFSYTVGLLTVYLARQKKVTRNVIMCAGSTYFLMAFFWATAFILLEMVAPGSFNNLGDKTQKAGDLLYFSFVTITTLGYGEITPATSQARALVIVETVIGQLFIAVMLARLVGIQTGQMMEKK